MEKPKKAHRPAKINWLFKRQTSKQLSTDSGIVSPTSGNFFGQELCKISPNGSLPKPVLALLTQLFLRGPFTYGIFRKSGNMRAKRELQSHFEEDPEYNLSDVNIHVIAAVFKEFLGCLPDCLLQKNLYFEWLKVSRIDSDWKKRELVLSLLRRLPRANVELLRHFLCILWHISMRGAENKMPSSNLAVCIGPSLLRPGLTDGYDSLTLQSEVSEKVPKVIEYLIDYCADVFGKEVLHLFGKLPVKDPSHQDSGAEELDSLHSLLENSGAFRRDDSSMDSLERALLDEASPKLPRQSKTSLTNLSRDSGLTLSDTQLYTPEYEVESSCGGAGIPRGMTKSVPHLETVGIGEPVCSRNIRVSIDGSCNDVVRRRRCAGDMSKCNKAQTAQLSSSTFSRPDNLLRESRIQQLQYSKSCSYRSNINLDDSSALQHDSVPHWRESHSLQQRGPIMSAVEGLVRSASEESLLNKYRNEDIPKRRPQHCKGKAPCPPMDSDTLGWKRTMKVDSSAKPDRHAVWFAKQNRSVDWKRSQSASKIDEIDHPHEASGLTLVSSGDSTPHISYRETASHSSHSTSEKPETVTKISQRENFARVSSVCSSSSETSHQSQRSQASHESNCSHTSQESARSYNTENSSNLSVKLQKSQSSNNVAMLRTASGKPLGPPSYQEAINRKTLFRRAQTVPQSVTEQMRVEQTSLSAKARQLYEESVKIYNQQLETDNETHHAILVKVDSCDECVSESPPPPLPPKPHQALTHSKSDGPTIRLRHHPPVHVRDSQIANREKCVIVSSFHDRFQNQSLYDFPKEISWSVAQLRKIFNSQSSLASSAPCSPRTNQNCSVLGGAVSHHERTDSIGSSTGGEESYV